MANKVVSENYGVEKHILIANNSFMASLPAIIKDTDITADSDGKKIVKAGTPLYGDLADRDAGFTASLEAPEQLNMLPAGVLLHDVDVTAGDENGTILLAGIVDLLKLDATIRTAITTNAQSFKVAMPTVIFVEGSAI